MSSSWIELPDRALRRVRPAVLAGVACTLLLPAGDAHACSCAEPRANVLRVGTGVIPSNAAGVPWWSSSLTSLAPRESLVTLERWEGEELRPVALELEPFEGLFLIRPVTPWSEGERYRISIDVGQDNADPEERFRVMELEVGAPLASGTLNLWQDGPRRGELLLLDRGGSCAELFDAELIEVGVSSPLPDLNRGILFFETYVDGQRWQPQTALCEAIEPGTSWQGRGRDRIVRDCSGAALPEVSVGQGPHTVRIDARLPGTDVVFSTGEVPLPPLCAGTEPGNFPELISPPAPGTGEAPAQSREALQGAAVQGAAVEGAGPASLSSAEGSAAASAGPASSGCSLSSSPGKPRASGASGAAAALLALGLMLRRSGARRRGP